jgi:hypothetical protein
MTKQQQAESDGTSLALLKQRVDFIADTVLEIKTTLSKDYATREWCESRFGNTTKQVNAILITIGTAIILGFAGWMLRGGLFK